MTKQKLFLQMFLKKVTCNMQNVYNLLAFLLIAVSIYCYLIKYQAKKKQKKNSHYHLTTQN